MSRHLWGNKPWGRKTYCHWWIIGVSVWVNLKVENSRSPSHGERWAGGYSFINSGAQPGFHSKYGRKIPSPFLERKGNKCHFKRSKSATLFLNIFCPQFSSVQLLSCVRLFATPWTAAHQTSLSITNSWSSPKLMSIESVMPSNHLILCCPLLPYENLFN